MVVRGDPEWIKLYDEYYNKINIQAAHALVDLKQGTAISSDSFLTEHELLKASASKPGSASSSCLPIPTILSSALSHDRRPGKVRIILVQRYHGV